MNRKEDHLLVDFFFFKADIEYPFEHGEVINYTLDESLQRHRCPS